MILNHRAQFLDLIDHFTNSLSSYLFRTARSSKHYSFRICLLVTATFFVSQEQRGSLTSGFLLMFDFSNRCESRLILIVCFYSQQVAFAGSL